MVSDLQLKFDTSIALLAPKKKNGNFQAQFSIPAGSYLAPPAGLFT
jgi:hypothetical protein